jgi:hypothetical protein
MAASGTETITGTIAASQVKQSMVASGAEDYTGAVSESQIVQTMVATAAETVDGKFSEAQAIQAVSASGTVANLPVVEVSVVTEQPFRAGGPLRYISPYAEMLAEEAEVKGFVFALQPRQSMSARGRIEIVGRTATRQRPRTAVRMVVDMNAKNERELIELILADVA